MARFRLAVRVNPGSSRQKLVWKGDRVKVNLVSPPEDGEANRELLELLGEKFNLREIELIRGETSREKERLLDVSDREQFIGELKQLKG